MQCFVETAQHQVSGANNLTGGLTSQTFEQKSKCVSTWLSKDMRRTKEMHEDFSLSFEEFDFFADCQEAFKSFRVVNRRHHSRFLWH